MIPKRTKTLIEYYFALGLQHVEILVYLATHHNIDISHRTLKRILSNKKLFRRKCYSPITKVLEFIEKQIQISSQLHGYRWMHLKCLQNGLIVKQNTVRIILNELDSLGVNKRKRKRLRRRQYSNKGPNYLWHTDCYDKLKPYGICISGCIDGFSRNIIWLEATSNSNNPRIIAGHYIQAVDHFGGCPRRLRADLGTENRYIEQMQIFFRSTAVDDDDKLYGTLSFLYGKSTSNQRIEAWWSILRKHHAQFWINLFENIKDDGYFTGTFLDKSLMQFCFLQMIQNELDEVAMEWNTHRISKSRNSIAPSGRPINMYHLPELYNTFNYICNIDPRCFNACISECKFKNKLPCDTDIFELCNIIIEEKQLILPEDPFSAVDLYILLRSEIISLL